MLVELEWTGDRRAHAENEGKDGEHAGDLAELFGGIGDDGARCPFWHASGDWILGLRGDTSMRFASFAALLERVRARIMKVLMEEISSELT